MTLTFLRSSILVVITTFTQAMPQCIRAAAEPSAGQAKWVMIGDDLAGKLPPKDGHAKYEGTSGVAVDPATGTLYLDLFGNGLWRSEDQGKSFEKVADEKITGRCETGFALSIDPHGRRMVIVVVYGNSARSGDAGKTWVQLKTSHLDCVAVDWADAAQTLLALRHESGGKLTLSIDGGQTWKDLDKGFNGVGVFDAGTLIATKNDGIYRSTDAGATWAKASDLQVAGLAMKLHAGVGYWTSEKGLVVSRDKGATWQNLGSPVNLMLGPEFGKEAGHIVSAGKDGIQETADDGKTWNVVAPLPPDFKPGHNLTYFAWDSVGNVFYASRMSKPAYKLAR